MSTIFLDIETLPALHMSMEDRLALARAKVPGNYKKPESIDKWVAENVEEQWRRTALDSMQGRLWILAWAIDDGPVTVFDGDDEEALLRDWAQCIAEERITRWVGHNVKGFDLPWLWRRSVKYGIGNLVTRIPADKWGKDVCDTMEMWAGTDYRARTSLDSIARYLGLEGKGDMDGSKVYDLYVAGELDKAREYCAGDVELCREVYYRMGGV